MTYDNKYKERAYQYWKSLCSEEAASDLEPLSATLGVNEDALYDDFASRWEIERNFRDIEKNKVFYDNECKENAYQYCKEQFDKNENIYDEGSELLIRMFGDSVFNEFQQRYEDENDSMQKIYADADATLENALNEETPDFLFLRDDVHAIINRVIAVTERDKCGIR